MSTNRGISRNPLQSNNLHYTKDIENNVVLGFRCEIHTRTLTIPHLDPKRVQRLELLEKLHNQGLSDKQTSTWFNDLGLKTPQDKPYTPSLVWVTRKKWLLRKIRENDTYSVIYPPQFFKIERIEK